jgi:hypothetical protein
MEATSPHGGARPGALELRPLRVTEIVDRAIRLYAKNALAVWCIAVPLVLLMEVVFALVSLSVLPAGSFVNNGVLYVAGSGPGAYNATLVLETFVGYLVVIQVVNGALLRVYANAYLGERPNPAGALGFALRHLLGLVVVGFLVGICVAIGAVVLILPGIYLYVGLCVAYAAYVVEGKRGGAALARSRELVRKRWWATFGALLLVAVVAAIATIALPALLTALEDNSGAMSTTSYVLLQRLTNFVGDVIVFPLSAAATITIYFDLRVRKEAFDIQQLGERLGITASGTVANADSAVSWSPPADRGDPFGMRDA